MQNSTIKQIASKLRIQKQRPGLETIVFIGAGVSKSSGIPLAGEIMKELEENPDFSDFVSDCDPKTYAGYMNRLTPGDRKRLFSGYIEQSKLNASYLYLATMVKEGYVDVIMTVNFDPLIIKALALVNVFPAVYDIAVSNEFINGSIVRPAVIFLHGQSHGFLQLNDQNELSLPAEKINKLFAEVSGNSTWIVVGYSGEDPVFNSICNIHRFQEGLHWVCYKDHDPAGHVMERLLNVPNKTASCLKGFDSDSFFRELKNELKLADPLIMSKPFTHLRESISNIGDFIVQDKNLKWADEKLVWIDSAIEGFEEGKGFEKLQAGKKKNIEVAELRIRIKDIFNNRKHSEIPAIEQDIRASGDDEAIKYLVYSYIAWGNEIGDKALTAKTDVSLFDQAIEKYKIAAGLYPDYELTFCNWGTLLGDLAKNLQDEKLFHEAFEKYRTATRLNPDYSLSYCNWAGNLGDLARLKGFDESIFREAFEKYETAIRLNPNDEVSYYNWGTHLGELAQNTGNEDYYNQAFEKFGKAAELNQKYINAFSNWGYYLNKYSEMKNNNPGLALSALQKYKTLIALNGENGDWYNGISTSLSIISKSGQADANAAEFLECIELMKKGPAFQHYNICCAYALLGNTAAALEWFEKALIDGNITAKHIEEDVDLDNIRSKPRFKELLDQYPPADKK